MTTTDVQLLAHARFVGAVQDAAERAANLPELQDALRAALRELNAALNPEDAR